MTNFAVLFPKLSVISDTSVVVTMSYFRNKTIFLALDMKIIFVYV